MNDEPVAHIRRPNPPWRDDALTECGKPEADFAKVISCDDAVALVRKHGQRRAAFVLCMTCMDTAARHSYREGGGDQAEPQDWRRAPIEVMERYLQRAGRWQRRAEERDRVRAELYAIGALVEAHRDEFDAFIAGHDQTEDLAARRRRRNRR